MSDADPEGADPHGEESADVCGAVLGLGDDQVSKVAPGAVRHAVGEAVTVHGQGSDTRSTGETALRVEADEQHPPTGAGRTPDGAAPSVTGHHMSCHISLRFPLDRLRTG
ncbi:hypothetical protein [Streptomyces sp. KMM 9044]|uniref:hypothetical protein n=1 Tax=Streptomyces sp. KMM 9044 TaxID=2744474 RepID=UPI002151964D|nr:hypothetical protein [Streptomyces sp. KMM 9044]WAX82208.1 hypothetical protein HUV60_033200 [Streptomyces sp. KMM 9044]